jgi:hypothetical protein
MSIDITAGTHNETIKTYDKWRVTFDERENMLYMHNTENPGEVLNVPIVRDVHKDLQLYLKRLGASDDSTPITVRNDTFKNMASEIIDGSDPYIWIRKGQVAKTSFLIQASSDIQESIDAFLKSDKSFSEFAEEKKLEERYSETDATTLVDAIYNGETGDVENLSLSFTYSDSYVEDEFPISMSNEASVMGGRGAFSISFDKSTAKKIISALQKFV